MRASHLSKERGVLELLAEFGASMTPEDKQLRTPLFVACAMDRYVWFANNRRIVLRVVESRLTCAQFLTEVLDSEEELTHRDRRGDTPMHAAACNGSINCLRMLLEVTKLVDIPPSYFMCTCAQNGMNPDVRNKKSYRPIDLAARRGHVECERLLTEYHMHHSTENYFDSVLFLATLNVPLILHDANWLTSAWGCRGSIQVGQLWTRWTRMVSMRSFEGRIQTPHQRRSKRCNRCGHLGEADPCDFNR